MMDFGWRNTFLKVSNFIPRATPNMMKASRMLTIIMPFSPKLMEMELRLSNCSFIGKNYKNPPELSRSSGGPFNLIIL